MGCQADRDSIIESSAMSETFEDRDCPNCQSHMSVLISTPANERCEGCKSKRKPKVYSEGYEWKNVRGQVFVYLPDHPQARKDGFVPRSHLVMSALMGRPVTHPERVWHKDEDPSNDDPENLVLFADQKALAQHRSKLYHEGRPKGNSYEELMQRAKDLRGARSGK